MDENNIKVDIDDSPEGCPVSLSSPSGSLISSTNSPSLSSISSTEASNLAVSLPTSSSGTSTDSLTSESFPSKEDLRKIVEMATRLSQKLREAYEKYKASRSSDSNYSDINPSNASKETSEKLKIEGYKLIGCSILFLRFMGENFDNLKLLIKDDVSDSDSSFIEGALNYDQMKQLVDEKAKSGEKLELVVPTNFDASIPMLDLLRYQLSVLRLIILELLDELKDSCERMFKWAWKFEDSTTEGKLDRRIFKPPVVELIKNYFHRLCDFDERYRVLLDNSTKLSDFYNRNLGNVRRIAFLKLFKYQHDFVYCVTFKTLLLLNEKFEKDIDGHLPSIP